MKGRILLIGELIASGGLGLQGDIITTTALGGQALTVPTFLSTSIQPSKRKIMDLDADFIAEELKSCIDSPGIDAIKLGAIHNKDAVLIIAQEVQKRALGVPLVVNPVLTTEEGSYLLEPDAISEYKKNILNQTDVLVVNIRDAELLSGIDIVDVESMCEAAKVIKSYGCQNIMLTGGLLKGEDFHDVLLAGNELEVLTVKKHNVHKVECYRFGGGWVLTTGIATSLGQGFKLKDAINRARQFIDKAIGTSFNADERYQNLNLSHTIQPFVHDDSTQPYTIIPGTRFRSVS